MSFTLGNFDLFKSKNDKYMNFEEGENKFRILSDGISGWEDWKDKKPVRYRISEYPKCPKPFDSTKPVKAFLTVIVWNHAAEKIQILQIKQATVVKAIQALVEDEDWGQPFFYDIKVTKTGEGMQTKYAVNPSPHKPASKEMIDAFKATPISLEALFDGLDPFNEESIGITPGVFEKADVKPLYKEKENPKHETFSKTQCFEIEDLLHKCTPEFSKKAVAGMNAKYGTKDVLEWPAAQFDKLKAECIKNIAQFGLQEAS